MVKEDTTFEGNLIKVGTCAEENDQLISDAKQTDIWFHLHNLPSCHVVIESSSDYPVTKQMIAYCANVTKQNTKYRDANQVSVIYTAIKNVRKTDTKGKVIVRGKVSHILI